MVTSQYQDPSSVALEGTLRIVNNILTAVDNVGLQQQLRQELARVIAQQSDSNIPVKELQQQYKEFAQRYLVIKQPFHWNVNNPNDPSNFSRDIDQYLELVEFCAFLQNTELLESWGINSLNFHGGPYTLAATASEYVNAFEYAIQQVPDVIKPYLQWLIQVFNQ